MTPSAQFLLECVLADTNLQFYNDKHAEIVAWLLLERIPLVIADDDF